VRASPRLERLPNRARTLAAFAYVLARVANPTRISEAETDAMLALVR
jgi:hypothetical protein